MIGAAALRLVLVSGRPLKEVRRIAYVPYLAAISTQWPMPALVEVEDRAPALWLKAGKSPHKGPIKPNPAHVGQSSQGVWIGLDEMSVALLQPLLETVSDPDMSAGTVHWGRLFPHKDDADLLAAVNGFRAMAASRLGIGKGDAIPNVENCMQFLRTQLSAQLPADPAVCWLVTNSKPKRNATKSYYSSLSLKDAQHYQHAAVHALPNLHTVAHTVPAPRLDPPASLHDNVIGSPFCPSEAALKQLGDVLRATAKVGRGRLNPERAREVDHAFTAYCWLYFSLHTGWRTPSTNFLPTVADIDWESGALLIEDKIIRGGRRANAKHALPADDLEAELTAEDSTKPTPKRNTAAAGGDGPSRRRWLPLGPNVRLQLAHYYEHTTARAALQRRNNNKSLFRPFANRKALESYLAGLTALNWDLPYNFNRHYLRSALIGRLSADAIDAYLGHWAIGSEAWWNGSCLDPLAYIAETQHAIGELFPASEWPVVEGFRVTAPRKQH